MTPRNYTRYQIAFQLGSRGSVHRLLRVASRAARAAKRRANAEGDLQGIGVVALDYAPDLPSYGQERPLNDAELDQLALSL